MEQAYNFGVLRGERWKMASVLMELKEKASHLPEAERAELAMSLI